MAWLGAGTRTGTNLDTIEWQPNTLWSGFQLVPAMTNGDCMMYVVCASNKVASHFIANIDTALGTANPGMSVRYWQPTDSWIAYHNVAGTTGSVTASAASYTASTKILLGVRVSGTALSISVNGAVTTGGTATLFTASRAVLNLENSANLVGVYDAYSTTGYSETLAVRLEGFLAAKHGITLPNGHPYRLSPPTLEWVPTDDSGLTIWYDFADSSTITVTGAGISDLKNKKNPATYNLTQSTDAYRPTWNGSVATGRDNSASDGLAITTTLGFTASDHMLLSVCGFPVYNGSYSKRAWNLYGSGGTTAGAAFVFSGSPNQVRVRSSYNAPSSSADITLFSGFTPPQNTLLGLAHVGTTKTIYNYGSQLSSDTNAANTLLAALQLKLMVSGDTTMSDFLVTSSTDTATRQRLEGYLAWKRGLQSSLPSGHPYRTKKPIYQEWTPADDASCIIWYDFADASTITITGAGISQLLNKVPGGTFTLTQSTDANRPSWDGSTATGRAVAAGDTTGLNLITTVGFSAVAYSVHYTAKFGNSNAIGGDVWNSRIAADVRAHGEWISTIGQPSNQLRNRTQNTNTITNVVETFAAETSLNLRTLTWSGGAGGTNTSYKNGVQINTKTDAAYDNATGVKFFLLRDSADNITLGDFLVTSATSTAIRQKYEGYLAWKRGLASSLPSDHPYKSRPPLTTD